MISQQNMDENAATTTVQPLTQGQIDYLSLLHDVPAARLNADMFVADDIDGVTESLFGSGNLNYLVMQSGQSNEASRVSDPFGALLKDIQNDPVSQAGDRGSIPGLNGNEIGASLLGRLSDMGSAGNGFSSPFALSNEDTENAGIASLPVTAPVLSSSLASVTGISTSANSSSFTQNDSPGLNGDNGSNGQGSDGLAGSSGINGSSGSAGTNGRDGTNGIDGQTPVIPGGDDIDLTADIVSPVLNADLDVILDPLEQILGDIDADLDVVLNTDNLFGNLLTGDILTGTGVALDLSYLGIPIVNNLDTSVITAPVNDVLIQLMDTVTPILDNVTDSLPGSLSTLANNLVDSLLGPENILVDLFNQGGDTDIHVSLLSDFGIFDGGPLALDIPIDPLESLVGDIDISLDNILDLDNLASGDFLSSALNINTEILPDISEAININDLPGNVESVVEDVPALVEDIVTSLPETLDELLGQDDGVLEGVDNIVASVLGDDIGAPVIPDTIDDVLGGILNPGTPDNSDQDLTLLGDISILGADIPLPGVDINLDIVEGIVGDIDVNADLNLDILTGADECDDLVTTLLGDAGLELDADIELLTGLTGSDSVAAGDLGGVVDNITDTLWPESSIIDALGDIASGNLGGGGGTSLPEPVGVITDTIGTVTETLPLGGLLSGGGGGGGHHHFGGLFG